MTQPALSYDVSDGVARIGLNRPDAGNALDLELARGLVAAAADLADLTERDDVAVVTITAAGPHFCLGGDLLGLASADDRGAFVVELARTVSAGLERLRELPVPIIAAVQGTAAGAGIGLILAADLVLSVRSAKFVSAYTAAALSPDCGVSSLLPAAVGTRRAALFALTGLTLDADTAAEWGLVTSVCEDDAFDVELAALIGSVGDSRAHARGETALLLRRAAANNYARQMADEADTIARLSVQPEADRLITAFAARSAKASS